MAQRFSRKDQKSIPATAQKRHYRIELHGQVDEAWMAAFDPIVVQRSDQVTELQIQADQAALRGVLNRLWDLNLDILSVNEIDLPAL